MAEGTGNFKHFKILVKPKEAEDLRDFLKAELKGFKGLFFQLKEFETLGLFKLKRRRVLSCNLSLIGTPADAEAENALRKKAKKKGYAVLPKPEK